MDTNTSTSLVNLGKLTKPATVLIEKISDALGGYFKPYQIRRVAAAEADADKIRAEAHVEISDLQRRALQRFVAEEARKQDNMEAITAKAMPQVGSGAKPDDIENDWIVNFFEKSRLISDDEMQTLWAKVLAGQANLPGAYSKRTVNYLASLDKEDAKLFTTLCGFGCSYYGFVPMIYDVDAPIYSNAGIDFSVLKHLDDIGLIRFDALSSFQRVRLPKRTQFFYYDQAVILEFPADTNNSLTLGHVLPTKVGEELAPVCGSQAVPGFLDHLIDRYRKAGIICSPPFPRPDADVQPPAA